MDITHTSPVAITLLTGVDTNSECPRSSILPPILFVGAHDINECVQPKSNKIHVGIKPTRSVPIMTVVSSSASAIVAAYILIGYCYVGVVSTASGIAYV